MYHDLQKLKNKPVNDFTRSDFLFVKQTVCSENVCNESGSGATSPMLALSISAFITMAAVLLQ